MKRICFFSSDARPLYKRDVFRIMSYPKNYIVHFRYQNVHIEGDPMRLQGMSAVIFYSMGNDLSILPQNRVITNMSIRDVTIHSVEKSEDTGQIHFYLKLGEFRKIEILNNPPQVMPPNKLVTELDVNEKPNIKWHEIIESIKASFPNKLFYNFNILDKKTNLSLSPEYDPAEKQSYYRLIDEKSYALQMGFYDTEPGDSNNYHSLRITPMNADLVKVVAPSTIDLETRRDNRIYSLFTKTISSSNSFTFINFETIVKSAVSQNLTSNAQASPETDTTLKIEVKKNVNRSLAFGLNSILTLVALGYGKLLTDRIDLNGTFNLNLTVQILFCLSLAFFTVYNLYRLFDKK